MELRRDDSRQETEAGRTGLFRQVTDIFEKQISAGDAKKYSGWVAAIAFAFIVITILRLLF